jgi:hypothetical protein
MIKFADLQRKMKDGDPEAKSLLDPPSQDEINMAGSLERVSLNSTLIIMAACKV